MDYPYYKKSSVTSAPFFPYIGLSDLPEVRNPAESLKHSERKKTTKTLNSPNEKTLCCRQIVEHKIELVPPAKKGTTKVDKQIFSTIEKVCPEVVIILGFIRKTITYTAVIDNKEIPNYTIQDDVPFQCIIESTEIKENYPFSIIEQKILSEIFAHEINFGRSTDPLLYKYTLAFNFIGKDIIKISIK